MVHSRLEALEEALGYRFVEKVRVEAAMTHSSLLNEPAGLDREDNQRLAHVGDAVIELAVRHGLFERFPHATKGDLTDAKKDIVSDAALARLPTAKHLAALIERGGSRPVEQDNDTVVAEAFEAILGAVFLDSNFETAAKIVRKHVPLPTVLPTKRGTLGDPAHH